MGREKYKKQYNSEQKEWIKNNAHIYKTTSEITKAFNKRFETDTPSYTIRSRLEVLFGSEGVREFNGHDRLQRPLFVNIEELKEKGIIEEREDVGECKFIIFILKGTLIIFPIIMILIITFGQLNN